MTVGTRPQDIVLGYERQAVRKLIPGVLLAKRIQHYPPVNTLISGETTSNRLSTPFHHGYPRE